MLMMKEYEESNHEVSVSSLRGSAVIRRIISTFSVFNAQLFTFDSKIIDMASVKEN